MAKHTVVGKTVTGKPILLAFEEALVKEYTLQDHSSAATCHMRLECDYLTKAGELAESILLMPEGSRGEAQKQRDACVALSQIHAALAERHYEIVVAVQETQAVRNWN